MKTSSLTTHLLNCMLLLLPIMVWNIIFTNKLPKLYSQELFEKDIPSFIVKGENILRLLVFVLPLLMPLQLKMPSQKLGMWIYIVGTVIYFWSWLMQMYFPQSTWSLSIFGFLAPAYIPLIWLIGISLIGSTLYFSSAYHSWMYAAISILFLSFHISHAATVYLRNI